MVSIPVYLRIAEQIKAEWLSSAGCNEGTKLPTQEELAERFGVSRSTIVRTLSKLAAEGYIHSQQGSGVYIAESPSRESNIKRISMIVPELRPAVIVAACRGVERRARQLGYQVLLVSSEHSVVREQEAALQHVRSSVEGIVIYPVTRRQQDLENDYLTRWSQRVPIVTIDIGCKEWRCTRVQFDNYRLCYEMTCSLVRHGHRHIAFMHTAPDRLHSSIHDRWKGWKAAMDEANLEIPASYIGWPVPVKDFSLPTPTAADYAAIAESLLCLHPRPDAVIAWNDITAAHLTQTLNNQGVLVPNEMRITGFDCDPLVTRLFRPLFPTSKPDFVRLGELAVDALADADEQASPRIYYYPVPLLWREGRSEPASDASAIDLDEAIVVA